MTTQNQMAGENAGSAIEPRSAAATLDIALLERVVVGGDLSKLSPNERLRYYRALCHAVGLNPVTAGFQYLYLQGRMVLYASRQTTEQLRVIHGVAVTKLEHSVITLPDEELYQVTAYGHDAKGRQDSATGAVSLTGARGQARADLLMKCESKAKRRLTLSLCGLGIMDESEVEVPPTAVQVPDIQNTPVLFPLPESERTALVQRARIGVARLEKAKAAELKREHLGSELVEYERADLAALVDFVRAVEETKL